MHTFCTYWCHCYALFVAENCVFLIAKNSALLFTDYSYLAYTKITSQKSIQKPTLQSFYLYDKQNGRTFCSNDMEYDLFGGFRLPFLLEGEYEGAYIGLINPVRLIEAGKSEFLHNASLTSDNQQQFEKLDEMSNPVVLFLKEQQ